MTFDIHVEKHLVSKYRSFQLNAAIKTNNDVVVVVGPSGSGKSLTIKTVAGLLTPDVGHVRINDRTLFDSATKVNVAIQDRHVAYIPQNYALFPHLTVEQNVAFSLKRNSWTNHLNDKHRAVVMDILEKFRIADLARQPIQLLSGGQQQRVALARALVSEPSVVLLDEPFSALDKNLRAHMRSEVQEIQNTYAIPMMLITHDEEDREAFPDAALVKFDSDGGGALEPVLSFADEAIEDESTVFSG